MTDSKVINAMGRLNLGPMCTEGTGGGEDVPLCGSCVVTPLGRPKAVYSSASCFDFRASFKADPAYIILVLYRTTGSLTCCRPLVLCRHTLGMPVWADPYPGLLMPDFLLGPLCWKLLSLIVIPDGCTLGYPIFVRSLCHTPA
jgi:hypothetical protein